MKWFNLPPKKREWKFSPVKLIISCVLIAALLISTSIGLSFAKYRGFYPELYTSFNAQGIRADGQYNYVLVRSSSGDTVYTSADGNFRIRIPQNSTGTSFRRAEYMIVRHASLPHIDPDYTQYQGQNYAYFAGVLAGVSYSTFPNLFVMSDLRSLMSLEIKVGEEVDEDTVVLKAGNTVIDSDDYEITDDGWLVYDGLQTINFYQNPITLRFDRNSWLGFADTDWYDGNDPYTIETAEELAGLAKLVLEGTDFAGVNITLGDDIDLAKLPWVPIGTEENPFRGNFSGGGHTISGMNIKNFTEADETTKLHRTAGLFGYAKAATIENLTLEDVDISVDFSDYPRVANNDKLTYDGPAIGSVVGWATATIIEGVHVSGLTATSKTKYIGGIVGKGIQGGGGVYDCSVTDSTFDLMPSAAQVGGIVGIHYSDREVNIKNCYVSANISGGYDTAGGIAAFENNGSCGLENCYFTGTISDSTLDDFNKAGIAAFLDDSANSPVLNNCYADVSLTDKNIFGEPNDNVSAGNGDDLIVVNSSWTGGEDHNTWTTKDGAQHTYYKSDDCTYSAGMSYDEFLDATPLTMEYELTITAEDDGNGSAKVDDEDEVEIVKDNGVTVTLTATADAGFQFDKWVFGEDDKYDIVRGDINDTTLVIRPKSDITATAKFKQSSTQQYTVTVVDNTPENIATLVDHTVTVNAGEKATIHYTKPENYVVQVWSYQFDPEGSSQDNSDPEWNYNGTDFWVEFVPTQSCTITLILEGYEE